MGTNDRAQLSPHGFSDENDMRRLLYCATVACAAEPFTFDVFEQTLQSEKIVAAEVRSLTAYSAFAAQFSRKQKIAGKSDACATQNVTIGSIAAKLIVSAGMDAHFVMHEMLVEDLPMYIEALNDKLRHEEESRRLWTFYAILPHVDGKKLKTRRNSTYSRGRPKRLPAKPGRSLCVASRSSAGS